MLAVPLKPLLERPRRRGVGGRAGAGTVAAQEGEVGPAGQQAGRQVAAAPAAYMPRHLTLHPGQADT